MKKVIGPALALLSVPTVWFFSGPISYFGTQDNFLDQLSAIDWGSLDVNWSDIKNKYPERVEMEDDYYDDDEEEDDLDEDETNNFTRETLNKTEYENESEKNFVTWANDLEEEDKKLLIDYLKREVSLSGLEEAQKILKKLQKRRDRKEAEEFFFTIL